NARATARPPKMYGIDHTSVSEMLCGRPNEPSQRPWYALNTSPPVATITTAPITRAVNTASKGTPNEYSSRTQRYLPANTATRPGRTSSWWTVAGGRPAPAGLGLAADHVRGHRGDLGLHIRRYLRLEVVVRRQADVTNHVAALVRVVLDRLDDVEHA